MENKKSIWGKYELKNGENFQFEGGRTLVFVRRLTNGWMISGKTQNEISNQLAFEACEPFQPTGDEAIFQTGRSEVLHVQPALPLKPVVLRNNKTINVSPKQSIKLYLAIPLNVQFYYSQADEEHLMHEVSLDILSDTWFGESDNGEPAFSIGQRVSLSPEDLELKKHEAFCPVKINNNSNHLLELQRLIIRVENLSLYQTHNQFITSRLSIDFKGPDQISNLDFSTDKSIHGDHPVLLAKARNPVTKTILGKSFYFIKHLTQ